MLDQWVKACVLRDDVKEGVRFLGRNAANVVGDVEVQSVRPDTGDLDVLRPISHSLNCRNQVERQLGLGRSHKYLYFEVISGKHLEGCRLHAFKVDEDDVGPHVFLPQKISLNSVPKVEKNRHSSISHRLRYAVEDVRLAS